VYGELNRDAARTGTDAGKLVAFGTKSKLEVGGLVRLFLLFMGMRSFNAAPGKGLKEGGMR